MNPFRSVLIWGIPLAFGSDSMPPGPLYGIRGALCHPSVMQRLTLKEAVHAYTAGGAHAEGEEHRKGRIQEGFLCDLVLLRGPIPRCEVAATVIGGTPVFDRSGIVPHVDDPQS
jgi:hypothetical protein